MKNNILNQKTDNFSSEKLNWINIQPELKNKFGKDIYESWIRKIEFINEYSDYILISVSTRFIRDWITSRYLDQILQIVKLHKKNISRIEFVIKNFNTEEEKMDIINITHIIKRGDIIAQRYYIKKLPLFDFHKLNL